MSLEVKNLVKEYGPQKAVNNISFRASKGEILGFLGPNGAGKSTTMKIATCYLTPSSGTVEVCGYDVQQSPVEVRKKVGYLPEHNPLYPDMYVHEYLGFIGSLHGLKGKQLQQRVSDMVELCGLTREQNKIIGALSKGYKQRVGFAQALLHDPEVLILDEPTSGFDPNQIIEIRQVIRQISAEKTVVFSTHIMQEVEALCHRVVIINLGRIVADQPVENLAAGKGEVRISLEFAGPVSPELLAALEGVKQLRPLGQHRYELIAKAQSDIRADIFRLAVANQWLLLEMHREELSLENVFYELTKK